MVESTRESITTMPSTPKWQVILTDLRQQIEAGRLKPGDRLPTKDELAKRYECSEQPVRRALAILEALGYTEGHQGVAVFVRARPAAQSEPSAVDPDR